MSRERPHKPLFVSCCGIAWNTNKSIKAQVVSQTTRIGLRTGRVSTPHYRLKQGRARRNVRGDAFQRMAVNEAGSKGEEEGEGQGVDKEKPVEDTVEDTKQETSATSNVSLPDLRRLIDGAGDPDCVQCHGSGQIRCAVCDGKGMLSLTMMDTTSASTCRLCQGRRIIPCPSCRSEVFRSVLWWDQIPSKEDDPDEKWRDGPDGPRIGWGGPPDKY